MTGVVNYHGLEHTPVGLWQFNGNMNDSSGNGFTLTVASGTERYSSVFPTLRGVSLVSTTLIYNTFTSTLAITGDITIECLISIPFFTTPFSSNACCLVSHENNGETSADNTLYSIDMPFTSGFTRFFWENGSGSDNSYSMTEYTPFSPFHLAVTRTSNVVQFYLNGRPWGAASGALTTPTGGGSGRLRVGSSTVAGPQQSIIASLKIVASALTATQIRTEFNRTLGGFYGFY